MPTLLRRLLILLTVSFSMGGHAEAEVLGPTYPIVERDMLEEIEKTLKQKERSGELAKLQIEAIDRSRESMERPRVTKSLPRAQRNRTHYFDPTFRGTETVRDHEGAIIAEAGTSVNPLDYAHMATYLLFINGDDPKQVELVDALYRHYEGNIKIVLIEGQPLKMTRLKGYQVYFDQGGALIRKLKIEAVPSLVSQEGKRLRIDELEVK